MPAKEVSIARISTSQAPVLVQARAFCGFFSRTRPTIGSNGDSALRVPSRIGILQPFANTESLTFPPPTPTQCSGTTETTGPTPEIIPLPERFFGGGGTSLRGFALNQAGPRDPCTGFPVGGQAMLVFNQEFRFPMRLPYIGTQLGGAIFYDGGNVYSRLDRITFRAYSPKPVFVLQDPSLPPSATNPTLCVSNCTNELNYFAHTIGLESAMRRQWGRFELIWATRSTAHLRRAVRPQHHGDSGDSALL